MRLILRFANIKSLRNSTLDREEWGGGGGTKKLTDEETNVKSRSLKNSGDKRERVLPSSYLLCLNAFVKCIMTTFPFVSYSIYPWLEGGEGVVSK
jgi:hypothetical protein